MVWLPFACLSPLLLEEGVVVTCLEAEGGGRTPLSSVEVVAFGQLHERSLYFIVTLEGENI